MRDVYFELDSVALHGDIDTSEVKELLVGLGVRTFLWFMSEGSVYYFPVDNDATTGPAGCTSVEQFTDLNKFIERIKELQLIYRG